MNRFLLVWLVCFCWVSLSQASGYDPLKVGEANDIEVVDVSFTDSRRNREVPLRIYLPREKKAAAVVLFSHGLGGSREGCRYLGMHWAKRGYVGVFVQHVGSDTSVWKDKKPKERMAAMKAAANGKNLMLRVRDIPAVLDQLEKWNKEKGHILYLRLDMNHVGMSGHSFGAVTTQAVSGQLTRRGRSVFRDSRIKAAIAFSPSVPRGGNAKQFGKVNIPWMLMTGTKDISVIGSTDMKSRLGVFPALPTGGKYEVVLYNAEHSAFTDRGLPGDRESRNPNHHRAILALSSAFWDAYLRGDEQARKWLDGEGVKSVLEKNDRWQKK